MQGDAWSAEKDAFNLRDFLDMGVNLYSDEASLKAAHLTFFS